MSNRWRRQVKQNIVAYLGGKCSECGYSKSITALQTHHIDPSTKKFSLSGAHCRKWEVLQAELDKCVLLCANCHAEIEYGTIGPSFNG